MPNIHIDMHTFAIDLRTYSVQNRYIIENERLIIESLTLRLDCSREGGYAKKAIALGVIEL